MNKRGFTYVDLMIVIVIIGLMAAMAFPAYHAVKMSSIEQAIKRGDKVSREQRADYIVWKTSRLAKSEPSKEAIRDLEKELEAARPELEKELDEARSALTPDSLPLQSIRIKNKTYYLFPKQDLKETTIDGQTFYLIPSS